MRNFLSRSGFWVCALAAYAILASFSFREFFTSHGDLIAGNFGDNRLLIFVMEHWHRVFQGKEVWRMPGYFYPATGVLEYTETVFLNSIPYSLLRFTGFDTYLAFEGSLLSYSLIGYVTLLYLLRRFLNVNGFLAIAGASIFAFSNLNHLWLLSAQTSGVMLIPALLILFFGAVTARPKGTTSLLSGLGFSLLLGLMFLSTYYMAWMFAFYITITGALAGILYGRGLSWPSRDKCLTLAAWAGAFGIALIPFLATCGPSIRAGQQRDFSQVLPNMDEISGVVNVGSGNVLWGDRFDLMKRFPYPYGVSPGLLGLFLFMTVWMFVRYVRHPREVPLETKLGFAAALAAGTILALLFKHNDKTLWWLVWRIAPGASAIRVIPRFMIVLHLFLVIVIFVVLQQIWNSKRGLGRVLVVPVALFLIAEQLNTAPVHGISRRVEMARLGAIGKPPDHCRTVFLIEDEKNAAHPIGLQIDTMLVAQRFGLPTINGYSGLQPDGWNLNIPKV